MPNFGSPLPRPVSATQGWGEPRSDHSHEGIDFPTPIGTPVLAIGDGTVITSVDAPSSDAGNYIAVLHDLGFVSRYLHLGTRQVSKGQRVSKGQQIALSGNTGIESSGPHLHFDVKMVPSKLSEYSSRYGTPVGGFGRNLYEGVGVPAEPLIPIDKYSERMLDGAAKYGIPLYSGGDGDFLLPLMIGVGGFLLWQALQK